MTCILSRLVIAGCAVAVVALAGCGSAATDADRPAPSPATTASSSDFVPEPGVPVLTGSPSDLSGASRGMAGTGAPPTGLVTQDVVVGSGPAATPTDTVEVRYSGTLYSDGTLFDSSWSRGTDPVRFALKDVVPGFARGIEGMQPGGRRVIVIPAELGYGARGTGPIPANATLVFVVDLVQID